MGPAPMQIVRLRVSNDRCAFGVWFQLTVKLRIRNRLTCVAVHLFPIGARTRNEILHNRCCNATIRRCLKLRWILVASNDSGKKLEE